MHININIYNILFENFTTIRSNNNSNSNLNEILSSSDRKIEILTRDNRLVRALIVQSGVALGLSLSSTTIKSAGTIDFNVRTLSQVGVDFGVLEQQFEGEILDIETYQVMLANMWQSLASYLGIDLVFLMTIVDSSDDIPMDIAPQNPIKFLENFLLTRVRINLNGNLQVKDPHLNTCTT